MIIIDAKFFRQTQHKMSKSHTTFFREEDVLSLNVKFTMQKELEVLIVVASKHVGATASGHSQQDLSDNNF